MQDRVLELGHLIPRPVEVSAHHGASGVAQQNPVGVHHRNNLEDHLVTDLLSNAVVAGQKFHHACAEESPNYLSRKIMPTPILCFKPWTTNDVAESEGCDLVKTITRFLPLTSPSTSSVIVTRDTGNPCCEKKSLYNDLAIALKRFQF